MPIIYLGIGTNLGHKSQNLDSAVQRLKMDVGDVLSVSKFYPSQPWGFESKHSFLNAVVKVFTLLSPQDLLESTQLIERDLGRVSKSHHSNYHDRIIDIDILIYDELIMHSTQLEIPHKWMHQRDFVLIPLAEIAPNLVHPKLGETILELKNKLLSPDSGVEKWSVARKQFDFPTKTLCLTLDLTDKPDMEDVFLGKSEISQPFFDEIKSLGVLAVDAYVTQSHLLLTIEVPSDFLWDDAWSKLLQHPRSKEWDVYLTQLRQAGNWELTKPVFKL